MQRVIGIVWRGGLRICPDASRPDQKNQQQCGKYGYKDSVMEHDFLQVKK
jgi:hypothetical protein